MAGLAPPLDPPVTSKDNAPHQNSGLSDVSLTGPITGRFRIEPMTGIRRKKFITTGKKPLKQTEIGGEKFK